MKFFDSNIFYKWHNSIEGRFLRQLFLLFVLLFVGLVIAAALSENLNLLFDFSGREGLITGSLCQALFAFILPAIVSGKIIFFKDYNSEFRYNISFSLIARAVLLILVMIPAMNLIIKINEEMTLPDFLGEFERKIRAFEETAAATTHSLINVSSVGAMLVNVLVIGIITGIAEEMFFRGLLQRIFYNYMNYNAAIWIAAAIFSFLHFQFFGFLPRLILGAVLGYLFYWSGSLYLSIITHALNNSLVVIIAWFENNRMLNGVTSSSWVSTDVNFVTIISSLVFSLLLLLTIKEKSGTSTRNRILK